MDCGVLTGGAHLVREGLPSVMRDVVAPPDQKHCAPGALLPGIAASPVNVSLRATRGTARFSRAVRPGIAAPRTDRRRCPTTCAPAPIGRRTAAPCSAGATTHRPGPGRETGLAVIADAGLVPDPEAITVEFNREFERMRDAAQS